MDSNSSTSNSNCSSSGSGSWTTPPPDSSPSTSQSNSSAPSTDLPLTAYTGPNIAAGLATFRGMTNEQQVDHVRGIRSRVDGIANLVRAAANPRPETETAPDIDPAETTNEPPAENTNEQLAETANEPPTTSSPENQATTVPRLRGMTFDQLRSHIVGILPIMVQENFPRLPPLSDFHLAIAIAEAQMLTEDSPDVETDDAYLNHTIGSVMDHCTAHSQDPAYLASRDHTVQTIRSAAAALGPNIAAHMNDLVFAETTDDAGYNHDDWMTDEDYDHETAEMRIELATEEAEEAAMVAALRAENEALRQELREHVATHVTVSVQHRPTNQHDWTAADVATLARDREEAENVRDMYHTINGVIMNGFESEIPAPYELEPANESMTRQAVESDDTEERLTIGEGYRMIAELSGDTLANFSIDNEPKDESDTMSVLSDDSLPEDPLDAYHENLEAARNNDGPAAAYDIVLTRVAGPHHYRAVGALAGIIYELTWTRMPEVIDETVQSLVGRVQETRSEADILFTGWWLAAARMVYREACVFTDAAHNRLLRGYTGLQSHTALVNALLDRFDAAQYDMRDADGSRPSYNNWALGHLDRTGQ
ncbi:hypothetical protein LTR56_010022 [Elasticomyces elasticus]|nr:hypothetical protein LTR56_010022 [Elasticomyces elasticus]KAK4931585.1 hypothetical protein LTR49_001974 [Elasticomyces elasticus]KAK5766744.1 hypothetical protein LTS12_003094 [Elasticomyces elasticus]